MSRVTTVPIGSVIQSKSQLRDVDKKSEEYKRMVETMKLPSGLINPISVREQVNADTNEIELILVDGAHRLASATEAGFQEIMVHIMDLNELEAMSAQIIGNSARKDTKHYEFAKQLRRMLAIKPELRPSDLANVTGHSIGWIKKLLKLETLDPAIGAAVDKGSIGVSSAIAIAQLPEDLQGEWSVKAAEAKNETEFVESVLAYQRERKKAEKAGLDPNTVGFVAAFKLRKFNEIKDLLEEEGNATLARIVEGSKKPLEAAIRAISYIGQVDENSIVTRKAAYDANKAKQIDTRSSKQIDAKRKLAEKREQQAAELRAELAASGQVVAEEQTINA